MDCPFLHFRFPASRPVVVAVVAAPAAALAAAVAVSEKSILS